MPNCQYTDFDIAILGSEPPYAVSAQFGGMSAEGFFADQIDDSFWQETVARLADIHDPPGAAFIHAAGARLFDALIAGDIQRLWMRADATTGSRNVRLRLMLQPPPVAALPWETLYDSARGQLFAASGLTPLVRMETQLRYLPTPHHQRGEFPVNVLLATADDAREQTDVESQRRRVAEVLGTQPTTRVRLHEIRGRFTVVELAQAVLDHDIHVLHLISHGEADGLLLWQNDQPHFVQSSALCRALERTTTLRLVYLSACLAGRASAQRAFTTVGPQLLQLGIPAVIAMQFLVSDHDAAELAATFYRELFTGQCPGIVDVAMGTARADLYALRPDTFGFGTPVLWLSRTDGAIAPFDSQQPGAQTETGGSTATSEERAVPSQHALLAWLEEHTPVMELAELPLTFRTQWPRLLQEYRDLVHQLPAAANQQDKYKEIMGVQEKLLRLAAQIRTHDDSPAAPYDAT